MFVCNGHPSIRQSELRVTDWYYEDIGFVSNTCCNWIIISIIHYKNILQAIADEVVTSGYTHDALIEYVSIFNDLIETASKIGEQYRTLCTNFVTDIDDWDQFVYQEGKSSKVIRDFSDRKFLDITRFLATTPPGGTGFLTDVIDWFFSSKSRAVQEIHIFCDEANRSRSTYIAALANIKNCDEKELGAIFERVKACDVQYSKKFGLLFDELYRVFSIVAKANEVMEKNVAFDNASITALKSMIISLKELKNKTDVYLDIFPTVAPTIEEIQSFTDDYRNLTFFSNFSAELNEFVYDISAGDVVLMAILKGKGIISTHYGTLSIPPEVPNEKNYEYVMLKKQLAEIIGDMSESDIEVSAESYERAKDIISIFSKSKRFASDIEKYKDTYDTLYKSANALKDGLGIGVDVSEIVVSMFAEYLENEKIIASLATTDNDGSLLSIAVQQLQSEYKDTFLMGTTKFFDYASTTLAGKFIDESTQKVLGLFGGSAGGMFSLVSFGINKAGEISGATEDVSSKLEFCTLYNSLSDIENSYKKSFSNVAEGNTTEQDILNLQNSFEILKRTYCRLYKLMGDSVGAKGDINKQAYYNYISRELNDSSISNGASDIVSYKDFLSI